MCIIKNYLYLVIVVAVFVVVAAVLEKSSFLFMHTPFRIAFSKEKKETAWNFGFAAGRGSHNPEGAFNAIVCHKVASIDRQYMTALSIAPIAACLYSVLLSPKGVYVRGWA